MKSAKILFNTIHGKCSNGDMYNWKACKPKEHDNVVSFDVRKKADNQLLCSCAISCFEEYIERYPDWPIGRVHFLFYDGCDSLEFNIEDYKCEVGSIYMNDIIDMAIKILYR